MRTGNGQDKDNWSQERQDDARNDEDLCVEVLPTFDTNSVCQVWVKLRATRIVLRILYGWVANKFPFIVREVVCYIDFSQGVIKVNIHL